RSLDSWCVRAIALLLALAAWADQSLAQTPLLQITSPSDGTVVSPGQTVVVVVEVTPGVTFAMVSIDGEYPLGSDQFLSAPPFRFSVKIPPKINAARKYRIFASGATGPGQGAESDPISLDVEPSSPSSKLRVEPSQINFESAGEQIPLIVTADFSDGSAMDITESSRTTYRSGDARVATVNATGLVIAIGVGTTGATGVIVRFGNQSVYIPVSTIRLRK